MTEQNQAPTAEQEARAATYAAIVEADDYELPADATPADSAEVDAFLAQIITPAERAAARGRGRPSLSGDGQSPTRQVRLPAQLDAALVERAKAEGQRPSDVLRAALTAYLV